jgi:hypothetical protein
MSWFLFIFVMGQNPYHIEGFYSMRSCEYAATKIEAGIKSKTIYNVYAICLPKNLQQ